MLHRTKKVVGQDTKKNIYNLLLFDTHHELVSSHFLVGHGPLDSELFFHQLPTHCNTSLFLLCNYPLSLATVYNLPLAFFCVPSFPLHNQDLLFHSLPHFLNIVGFVPALAFYHWRFVFYSETFWCLLCRHVLVLKFQNNFTYKILICGKSR